MNYDDIRRKEAFKYFEKFANVPTRTLTRILMKDLPLFFNDWEAARRYVRYWRGQCGEKDRKKLSTKKFMK